MSLARTDSSPAASRAVPEEISLPQARRIALRAQGLDRPRRPVVQPTARHLNQVVDRLGLFQIDSVNVLARAHLMPTFSRVGPYDVALLDRATSRTPRRLVEAWAHEASLLPPATYRLLGFRQRAWLQEAWGMIADVPLRHAPVVEEVRAILAERGPVTAREVHAELEHEHPHVRKDWGWSWSVAKRVLEFLFFTGQVTSAGRNPAFERRYDLTERVLPPEVLATPEPDEADAIRTLVEIGARAHGIGTQRCLADYFRLKQTPTARAIAELADDGVLLPVRVRGWDRPAWLHRDATLPRRATGRALVSPFDPVVWERRRLEELFGMWYRIEIYVPEAKRVHGYYVLPFLLGDSFVARVDLKADRATGRLLVRGAFREAGAPPETAAELAAELSLLGSWLGVPDVRVEDGARGDLGADLAAELGAAAVR